MLESLNLLKTMKIAENPLAGGTILNWLHLLLDNNRIKLKYWPRVVYITFMTLLLFPVRLLQRILYSRKIRRTKLETDPVFVLGSFRSGGTHLMNTLINDPQWGFVSTTQALVPDMFLLGKPIRDFFNLFLHEKRPQDNIRVTPESPEEPEHAIGNMIPYGFFQGFCFPDRMMDYFNNSVTFENDPSGKIQKKWEATFTRIIQACSLANKGKQLLVKNPPDTARISKLLKFYPNAKFIYLQRNPYVLFPSIKNFLSVYIVDWQLSDIEEDELDANVLEIYKQLSESYQRDKDLIPKDRLVELKFEDFEKNPIAELERIYKHLNISDFDKVKSQFGTYINSQKNYKKNKYTLSKSRVKEISQKWSADIQRWKYNPPEGMEVITDA